MQSSEINILTIKNMEELRGKLINIRNSEHVEWLSDDAKIAYYQMDRGIEELIYILNKDLNK